MATSNCPDAILDNVDVKMYISEHLDQLSDVYKVHKQKLEECEEETAQWKKFLKGYNVLKERLTTFPDKTSYETMVPIGSMAFMKGKQIHTNEILVHLGDNWFAERSSKDAICIIDRRKQVCEDNLKTAEKQCEIHKNWLNQINKLLEKEGKQVDIIENVSEEEYQKSIEQHKEMIARHYDAIKKRREEEGGDLPEVSTLEEETSKFENLLKRLDELEEIEKIQDEKGDDDQETDENDEEENHGDIETITKDESSSGGECVGREKLRRRVSWADQIRDAVNEEEEEETTELVTIKYGRQKSLPSEFIHTAEDIEKAEGTEAISLSFVHKEKIEDESESESSGEPATPDPVNIIEGCVKNIAAVSPQSPSDIYKMFGTRVASPSEPPPKGILKKKSGGDSFNAEEKGVGWNDETETVTYIPNSPDEEQLMPLNPPLSESPREIKNLKAAFSYKVVAKDEEDGAIENANIEGGETLKQQSTDEPKRISRFKASRIKKS